MTRYTPEGAPGKFYDDYCNWQRIDGYRSFVFNSPGAAIVGALMRSNEVRFYHEHVLACPYKGTRDSRGNSLASRPALLQS